MKMLSGPAAVSLVLWVLALLCSLLLLPGIETFSFALSIILLSFSLLGAAAACVREGKAAVPRSPLLLIGFGFWALAFLSVLWSAAKFESYLYFWFFSALPLSALVFLLQPDKENFFKAAAAAAGVFAVVLALCSVGQYLFKPEMLFHGRVQWPMEDPNSLAAVLFFGMFGFLAWMLGAEKKLHSNMALVLCLVCFAALLTTGSRGAFIALITGAVLFLILARGDAAKHKRCLGVLFIGSVLAFIGVGLIAPVAGTAPHNLALNTLSGAQPGLWTRPYIWASSWGIIQDHFWTGTGIGTFSFYYPAYRLPGDFASAGAHAHNDALQFWAEMGVAAPVLFYAFIIGGVMATLRAPKNIWMLAAFCALGAMIMQAHVTSLFHVLPVLIVAGATLALWLDQTHDRKLEIDTGKIPFALSTIKLVGFLFFLGVFCAFAASEIHVQRAKGLALAGEMGAYAGAVNRASAVVYGFNPRPYLMAATVPLGIVEDVSNKVYPGELTLLAAQTEVLLEQARQRNPRIVEIPFMEGRLALAEGRTGEGIYFLREALALDPRYLDARQVLAAALRKNNQPDEADKVLKEAP